MELAANQTLPAGEHEEHLVWRSTSDAGEHFLKCHSKLDAIKIQVCKELMLQNEKLIFMLKDAEIPQITATKNKETTHTYTKTLMNYFFPLQSIQNKFCAHELWKPL